ncbi:MAG TPA: hypothetical protein VFP26_13900 [Gemmatimonadaceae bacterium]|jgi:hypothetical protein|nr:hypothetical protein [Gemmatimonadaceae bacterium]
MTPRQFGAIALVIVGGGMAASFNFRSTPAEASCNVQGVWRTEKVVTNGRVDSTSAVEIKIATKNHFAWVSQENRRDTLPLKTFRDSVRVYSDGGGYGTYRVSGNQYVERIELFPNPDYVGKEWPATCQTTGNSWIHSWISPEYKDSTGRTRRDTVAEYYRRVE